MMCETELLNIVELLEQLDLGIILLLLVNGATLGVVLTKRSG